MCVVSMCVVVFGVVLVMEKLFCFDIVYVFMCRLWWVLRQLVVVIVLLFLCCSVCKCSVFWLQVMLMLLWLVVSIVFGVWLWVLFSVIMLWMCMCLLVSVVLVIGYGLKVCMVCVSILVFCVQFIWVLVLFSLCVQVMFCFGCGCVIGLMLVCSRFRLLDSICVFSLVSLLCSWLLVLVVVIGSFWCSSIGLVFRFVFICIRYMLVFVLLVWIVCWIGVVLCQCGSSEVCMFQQLWVGIVSIVLGRIRLQVIIIIRFGCSLCSCCCVVLFFSDLGWQIGMLWVMVLSLIGDGVRLWFWLVGWLGWVQMVMILWWCVVVCSDDIVNFGVLVKIIFMVILFVGWICVGKKMVLLVGVVQFVCVVQVWVI